MPSPAITRVMQPVIPGRLAVLTVGGMRDDVTVYLHRLKGGNAREPGAASAAIAIRGVPLKTVQRKDECLTVDIPNGPYAALAFSLSQTFDAGSAVVVNTPRLDWCYPSSARPGNEFRLVGRNLVSAQHYPTTDPANPTSYGGRLKGKTQIVARREDSRGVIQIPVIESSGYDARLAIPARLKPGAYEFFAHNGLGGALGWSRALCVNVEAAEKWPSKTFRVENFQQTGDASMSDAVDRALAAINENGGGVLQFGPGVHSITRTIVVPPRTVIRGAGERRTRLDLPQSDGPKPPYVLFTGDRDFVIEDLRVFSLYAPLLVAAPTFSPDNFDDTFSLQFDFSKGKRARNVAVRRCHLIQRINSHEDRRADSDGGKYKIFVQAYQLSQGQSTGGFAAIALRGDDFDISDNTIFGGGSGVMMFGCTAARIAHNHIEIGAAGHGIYAMGHLSWADAKKEVNGGAKIEGNYCKQIIIEDNEVTGASQTARDGVYLMYGVEKSLVARNFIHDIISTFDAEGLGLHLWSGRWTGATMQMESPTRGRIIDPTGIVTYECLDDAQVEIVEGPGMGQLRRIRKREGDYIELDEPWAYPPEEGSQVVYTAPPLFNQVTLVDNRIHNTGANLIMWGCNNDVVVDGNRLADGPHLGVWSVRVQGDQKVWGGSAFVSVINNVNEMGWVSPSDAELGKVIVSTGWGNIGNPSCTFADSEKMGYDFLGLMIRNNATINNSGIFFRKTFGQYGSAEPWVLHDYGVVIEGNLCKDSRVGVVIEKGAAVVERRNKFEKVEHKVIWADPPKISKPL